MARPKIEDLQKHTMNLRRGDMEAISHLFPGKPPNIIIRRLVSKFVDQMRKTDERKVDIDMNLE